MIAPTAKGRRESGLALIESLIAILLISFGIIGIIGLQARSISFTSDARYRVEASALADRLIAEMWISPTNLAGYAWAGAGTPPAALAPWVAAVEATLPGADLTPPTVAISTDNTVTITLAWRPPGGSQHSHVVITNINQNPEN